MTDAARLLSELTDRLGDLNAQVVAFQQEKRDAFQRDKNKLFTHCLGDVSSRVERALKMEMSHYPALFPPDPHRDDEDNTNLLSRSDTPKKGFIGKAKSDYKSPPPMLSHTSGTPLMETTENRRLSPHKGDELRGLFTPLYLPLLERQPGERTDPSAGSNAVPSFSWTADVVGNVDEKQQHLSDASTSDETRPEPHRFLTDRSSSSIDSSSSEAKTRRNALRCSSSFVKGSPRRVRFDVEGKEVLPSSSPQAFSPSTPNVEAASKADISVIAVDDDSTSYSGPSLLDVEGEEDSLPRPKKVSSTQALRALSRCPLEEGTVWTLVNADLEAGARLINGDAASDHSERTVKALDSELVNARKEAGSQLKTQIALAKFSSRHNYQITGPPEQQKVQRKTDDDDEDEEDQDESDDDEYLSMKPKASRERLFGASRENSTQVANHENSQPHPLDGSTENSAMNEPSAFTDNFEKAIEQETVFGFDLEEVGKDASKSPPKYLETEELEEDELKKEAPELPSDQLAMTPTSIPRMLVPSSFSNWAGMTSRNSDRRSSGFMGTPFTVGSIKNSCLYDEISAMDDVPFFVGSVHGRTGVDAINEASYRVSMGMTIGVTPRSFGERLALEEVMKKRSKSVGNWRRADSPSCRQSRS